MQAGNELSSHGRRRAHLLAVALGSLFVLAVPIAGVAQVEAGVAQVPGDAEASAVATMMLGIANGVAQGAEHAIGDEVIGWTLTSLGLDSDPNAEVVAALEQIEQTLIAIEDELADISALLAQQSCQNAADVAAVQNALDAIDVWVGRGSAPVNGSYLALVNDAQLGVDVTSDMVTLFDWTLNGSPALGYGQLEDLLVGLDNALRDQGNAEQLISACGLLIEPSDFFTDEWDDRAYFQQLANLVGFYAEYQARAALLVTEAYHFEALQAWLAAGNDPSSLQPEDVPSICDDPTGDILKYCVKASDAYNTIRTDMRAQYGEAGAPYSSGTPTDPNADFDYDPDDPVVQIRNPSGYVWVKNIDDFFKQGGYSTTCQASTSASPCGPGVANYDHLTFEKYHSSEPVSYGANGGYTLWKPAPVSEWAALMAGWDGQPDDTTLAEMMTDTHGFVAWASTARNYYSGEADDIDYEINVDGPDTIYFFDARRTACFVATPLTKGNVGDFKNYSCLGLEEVLHGAKDHTNSNAPCYNAVNTTHGTLDDAGIESPFFTFLYNIQPDTCQSSGHPEGRTFYPGPPGWLLQYESSYVQDQKHSTGLLDVPRSSYHNQYHWPVFDANTVTCVAEPATGVMRSRYALNGRTTIPRLCGADFDAWFEKWISPNTTAQPVPVLSRPEAVVELVPSGSTAALAHHEVTAVVDYAHLVSALDAEAGRVPVSCFPASGQPFQLGTTQVRCSATDSSGATSVELFDVHVRYPFQLSRDLDHKATRVKAGKTLTITFSLGGDRGLDAVVGGGPTSMQIACASGETLGEPELAQSPSGLKYKPGSQRYHFQWKTNKAWSGQCRELRLDLADGTRHNVRADFR